MQEGHITAHRLTGEVLSGAIGRWRWREGELCCSCLSPPWSGSKPWDPELQLKHFSVFIGSQTVSRFYGLWRNISKAPSISLEREKVRANHVELEQLPHNHECAFSDIIKMHWALKQASTGWLCSRGKWTLTNEANLSTLLLPVILYEVSLHWLHQTVNYTATAWRGLNLLN